MKIAEVPSIVRENHSSLFNGMLEVNGVMSTCQANVRRDLDIVTGSRSNRIKRESTESSSR